MTSILFKSSEGRATIERWHQRFRAQVPAPLESRRVSTRFGETHALVGGPADAPPLVMLHGALASSAHLLVELAALLPHFRVYAVDVLGQSVMSADARLRVDNDDAGAWLGEVLDGLGLQRVRLIGVSWGGFVAQRFAAVAPTRVERLALLVPAGVVGGSGWKGFTRMGLPMTLFLMAPTPARLDRFAAALLTTLDDDWKPYLGDAFTHYRVATKIPALSRDGDFEKLDAPVLVVAAEHDVSFPGQKLLDRARQLFREPQTELLAGSQHSPPTTPAFRAWMGQRLLDFFR